MNQYQAAEGMPATSIIYGDERDVEVLLASKARSDTLKRQLREADRRGEEITAELRNAQQCVRVNRVMRLHEAVGAMI